MGIDGQEAEGSAADEVVGNENQTEFDRVFDETMTEIAVEEEKAGESAEKKGDGEGEGKPVKDETPDGTGKKPPEGSDKAAKPSEEAIVEEEVVPSGDEGPEGQDKGKDKAGAPKIDENKPVKASAEDQKFLTSLNIITDIE